MRAFRESTCRNLLTRPLVLGVPSIGLLVLCGTLMLLYLILPHTTRVDSALLAMGLVGYGVLRLLTRFGRRGFEEAIVFTMERAFAKIPSQKAFADFERTPCDITVHDPDTANEFDLIRNKIPIVDRLRRLAPGERLTLVADARESGLELSEITSKPGRIPLGADLLERLQEEHIGPKPHVYSLTELPPSTDPRWLFDQISQLSSCFRLIVTVRGLDPQNAKRRVEGVRRLTSFRDWRSSVDEEVAFEDSSRILEQIIRGEELLAEVSLVIVSDHPISGLDRTYFLEERNIELALTSIFGLRNRSHRSFVCRLTTASDLVPTFWDPSEKGVALLKTRRGNACYFDPLDTRLEAPHWLVVGATGTGKSFFTGTILHRLIQARQPISVLFIDHNRSFRRIVRSYDQPYLEPRELDELSSGLSGLFESLDKPHSMAGVELSELILGHRKDAIGLMLSEIEKFLRRRSSNHTVYIVLDECWAWLRSDPERIQRAFREYRKLGGAAIAITQSLSDFLSDESGESIFQNAGVRILLRQGEDMLPHRSRLGLNDVEIEQLRYLQQKKGVFSECLIKTPFSSRIGRLYPTPYEHDLLRTDNLRQRACQVGLNQRSAAC